MSTKLSIEERQQVAHEAMEKVLEAGAMDEFVEELHSKHQELYNGYFTASLNELIDLLGADSVLAEIDNDDIVKYVCKDSDLANDVMDEIELNGSGVKDYDGALVVAIEDYMLSVTTHRQPEDVKRVMAEFIDNHFTHSIE